MGPFERRLATVNRIAKAERIPVSEVNDLANLLAQGSHLTVDQVLDRVEECGLEAVRLALETVTPRTRG